MRRAIDAGEPVRETIRNYRRDGTPFWNQITLAPLERNGEIPYYVGFQQDVTDRMEYEQQLQDQRDSLHLLSQIVRHDIRNDLHVIKGYVDLLEEYVTDDGEELLGTVRVRVADNGPGVPAERKDEIFGRGAKGTDSGGTGIGTYLVETLVTRYGGDVWVEDNEPQGAVFVVELPVAD